MYNSKGVFSRFLSFVKAQSPAYWIYKTLGGGDTAAAEKAEAAQKLAAEEIQAQRLESEKALAAAKPAIPTLQIAPSVPPATITSASPY